MKMEEKSKIYDFKKKFKFQIVKVNINLKHFKSR